MKTLQRATVERALARLARKVEHLEKRKHGALIYVGTYPTDPNTTDESPPFQNGWASPGGDFPPLAFHMGVDGHVYLEGTCDGGADGTVIFTLPEGYRPDQSVRLDGALSSGSDFWTVQVDPTGDVICVARGFDPGRGGIAADKVSTSGASNGDVLTVVAGVAAWAAPAPGSAATTDIKVDDTLVGSRGTLNVHHDGVISVAGADDATDDEVDLTIGVSAGGEGQVLTTVSGVAIWQDPAAPTTPPTVYPSIAVNGTVEGSEAEINFEPQGVIDITATDVSGTEVDVTVGISPGTDGQTLQTVAGVAEWADPVAGAKTLIINWFGAIPAANGPTQVFRVPYINGVSRTFDLQRLTLRVETTGTTTTSITLQKSPSGGSFVATAIGSASVASGIHEDSETAGLGTVSSGDLVRVNFTARGAGAASYFVEMEALEEV